MDCVLNKCSNLFAVQSRTAKIYGRIPVRGYAGHSGRLDVLMRSMLASLFHEGNCFMGIIGDEPEEKVFITTDMPSGVSNERELFLYFMKCVGKEVCGPIYWIEQGAQYVFNRAFKKGFILYYLSEEGDDYCVYKRYLHPTGNLFVLGSHLDVSPWLSRMLKKYSPRSISIGPTSMHTSHVIVYLTTILERMRKKLAICPKH